MGKIIFIGGIYPECRIEEIKEQYGSLPQAAADSLQKSIIAGLEENTKAPVTVFNTYFLPMSFSSFKKTESYTWQGEYGENYNLSFSKNRLLSFNSKTKAIVKAVSKWLKENAQNETVNVVVYPAYFPFLKAVNKLKKKFDLNVCLVVPDLPQFMGLTSSRSLYNKLSTDYSTKQFNKYLKNVDSFILLTEEMNDVINKYNKPYRIIEGIAPSNYEKAEKLADDGIKTVVYSGRLQLKYGIELLLRSFAFVKGDNIRFDFYGDGEAVDTIKEFSQTDSRIRYMGTVLPDELHRVQQNSTVLVNPRTNDHEFTKYSFPSKTMEYMLSGRPVIGFMLDGMPEEYREYINIPEEETPEKMAEELNFILSLTEEQSAVLGERARDFALKNKNCKVQTEKILELFDM